MRSLKKCCPVMLVIVVLVSAMLLSGCSSGSSSQANYQPTAQLARTEIWKDINAGKASGASVAILDNGAVVYAEGMGPADRTAGTVVNPNTLFNMGSVSKTFDAAALMVLVDQGKVSLDAPVTKYLPEFKMQDPRYKDVTVRMLLNHTSGFPGTYYANNMGYAFNKAVITDTMSTLAQSSLKAAPGFSGPYCNDGFTLAEMIVAKVGGEPYLNFVADKVCKPLGIPQIGASVGERPDAGICRYYQSATGKIVPPEVLSIYGAGGLSSSASDLVTFIDSFSKGGKHILSDNSIAEMTKGQPSQWAQQALKETGTNPEMTYGLGFDLTSVPKYQAKGLKVIAKGGDSDDYHSMMVSIPDKRLSVAVMEAGQGSRAPDIAFELLDSMLEAKGLMKKETKSVVPIAPQPLPADYVKYNGYYGSEDKAYMVTVDTAQNMVNITFLINGVAANTLPMTYNGGMLYLQGKPLFKMMSAGGRDAVLVSADGGFMVFCQKLQPLAQPQSLSMNIDGKQWVRRNVKPFEGIGMDGKEIVNSAYIPGMPGYVIFNQVKKVDSPTHAGMVTDVTRDQTELNLYPKDGQTWAWVSDFTYSPADAIGTLSKGQKQVTIGKEGYSEWFKTGQDLVLDVKKPSGGRLIVFGPDTSVVYDSEIDTGKAFAPAGSFVEVAGTAGQVFGITADQPQ